MNSFVEPASCRGMGILGGTGILPVSCLLSGGHQVWNWHLGWNWHLASFMLIIGRASGVEWASWVELASCQFQYIFRRAGCPLYSYSSVINFR
ncbi:hypothetical protein [Moorena producens]|uniref:hypothetical protein n=1 Tax=Moorena producens TaxID=1155739 RepID=UPI003C71494B